MIDFDKGTELMDRPEIVYRLFFPRRELPFERRQNGTDHSITVGQGISIGCRFYAARKDGPSILYFHGNGEIASDYDYVAPLYQQLGLNLFVTDYRGYGTSDGSPSCTAMIRDSHPLFEGFVELLQREGCIGRLFVMGRSLGSAPAIEVAYRFQMKLNGLIVESGFAGSKNQFARIGVTHLFPDIENSIGFGNDIKIKGIHIPTLIIHGEEDEIIPVTEGRELLKLAGTEKKDSLFVPGAGHNDLLERGLKDYMGKIASFIREFG